MNCARSSVRPASSAALCGIEIPQPAGLCKTSAITHLLIDGAENRAVIPIQHIDAHAIAEFHEWRLGCAVFELLKRALLCNTTAALGGILVRYGAGDDDRTRSENTR